MYASRRVIKADREYAISGKDDSGEWAALAKGYGPAFVDFLITSMALRGGDVTRQLFLRTLKLIGQGLTAAGVDDMSKRKLCLPYTSYTRDRGFELDRLDDLHR
jgi:hypothetical protein